MNLMQQTCHKQTNQGAMLKAKGEKGLKKERGEAPASLPKQQARLFLFFCFLPPSIVPRLFNFFSCELWTAKVALLEF